jgi:hypothetical protein
LKTRTSINNFNANQGVINDLHFNNNSTLLASCGASKIFLFTITNTSINTTPFATYASPCVGISFAYN